MEIEVELQAAARGTHMTPVQLLKAKLTASKGLLGRTTLSQRVIGGAVARRRFEQEWFSGNRWCAQYENSARMRNLTVRLGQKQLCVNR